MAATVLLDTNVLLRYLTNDDPRKAARVEQLFRRAQRGELTLHLTDLCLAELVWTLESYYELPRGDIAGKLRTILNTDGLEADDETIWLDALHRYETTRVDLVDAYHAAIATKLKREVVSYDRDFDQFADVRRVEP